MNSLRLSFAQHLLSFAGAIIIVASLFVGATAIAQPRTAGAYYTATMATPASAPRAVAGSLVWNCAGTTCSASRGTSRPAIVCARLVRELGPVTSFVANGQALEAADLQRCNAAAA